LLLLVVSQRAAMGIKTRPKKKEKKNKIVGRRVPGDAEFRQ
jgi:hypothetical protein